MHRPIVMGRVARAEVCPCARSVVLSVGALSLRLQASTAEDVALTLMQALGLIEGDGTATDPAGVTATPPDPSEGGN
jgi:hypothetical protein